MVKPTTPVVTEVTDAPDVDKPPEEPVRELSANTLAEMELGRKTALANAAAQAVAEAARAKEKAEQDAEKAEREGATAGAQRLNVYPHAAGQQVKQ